MSMSFMVDYTKVIEVIDKRKIRNEKIIFVLAGVVLLSTIIVF